jgi:signal transduction histidine kinase
MTHTFLASTSQTPQPNRSALEQGIDYLQSQPVREMLGPMFRRLGLQSIYVLTNFPLALAAFVVTIIGISLGTGLIIVIVGLPVLMLTLYMARGFAWVERFRLTQLMGHAAAPPPYRAPGPNDSPVRRAFSALVDPQSWLDVVHALLFFPVAVFTWSLAVTWWSTAIGGTTWALWGWAAPNTPDLDGLVELLGLGSSYPVKAVVYTVAGLFCLVTLPLMMAALSHLSAAVSNLLLVAPGRHRSDVERLSAGRDAAQAAEGSSLRRLERDIHDGPQQRLVRLAMDLGRAQQKVGDNEPELADTLSQAQQQTQDTLNELRALSRGIAPPILADRGLQSALEELAAGAVIPTTCSVDLGEKRLAPYTETAVYFVVAEALTNASKHSGATAVTIEVARIANTVRASVTDNGSGGAHPSKGHGLAGLQDRVLAADGIMHIDSPTGGPTVVIAELPCG